MIIYFLFIALSLIIIRILLSVCKGIEIKVEQLQRRFGEVSFAFEKVLQGDDPSEILNQKLQEIAPCAPTEDEKEKKPIPVIYDKELKQYDLIRLTRELHYAKFDLV